MNYAEKRSALVDWIRAQLIGPWARDQPLRDGAPLQRYPVGVLFPLGGDEGVDSVDEGEEDELAGGDAESSAAQDQGEPTQVRRRYTPPSSVGFSFFIRGPGIELQVQCAAARYELDERGRDDKGRFVRHVWKRVPLPERETEFATFVAPETRDGVSKPDRRPIFRKRALIDVLWRPHGEGWIATVSLVNHRRIRDPHDWQQRNETALFEAKLHCTIHGGVIGVYPRVDRSLLSDEEQELELQYRHRHIYAVGHGAAVDWQVTEGRVSDIWTTFMPAVEVPQVTADVEGTETAVLDLRQLAACATDGGQAFARLDGFINGYSAWVEERRADRETIASDDRPAADRILARMDKAITRMGQGLELLREDSWAAQAFAIANQVMLDQMAQADRCRKRPVDLDCYRWRPFQLAFLLTVIESAIDPDSDFRDTVDLIWFPTGGGKTEAYLGLIAFVIAHRRLINPTSGGGTTVLMRYTLRLLTTQQYQRATRVICALELLRRARPALGQAPITIGMWVGEATSPNRYDKAHELVRQAAVDSRSPPRRLVLDRCPWCETPFQAPANYTSGQDRFHFRCTNAACEFGSAAGSELPCNVVDEALYAAPPTLLIATIDKFARLAWDDRSSAFFGSRNTQPPALIIQDELHLIAGALGSVAGLYEAALDTAITARGMHPKYVASTATIRMADKQVCRLYGRDVTVFPPPGLDCDDSYFARTVPLHVRPGRLYVGYLTYALPRAEWMAPLAAALLAAPERVFDAGQEDRDDLLDAWWTQVVYHGSLKGVGISHTSFTSQVRNWLGRFVQEARDLRIETGGEEAAISDEDLVARPTARIAQLTSIAAAEENARTFARLEHPRGHPDCLDAVLATNMVSVGLDVARLALMVINGQPLTTAEYIQASSRVGRAEVPGIVFAHYYRTQARSLSHYENFRPYHESFYRFVEPTSITPFTYQARMRALHAALVIAVRHGGDRFQSNSGAGEFDPANPAIARVIDALARRCRQADPQRGDQTEAHLRRLAKEWKDEAERCRKVGRTLVYQAPGNQTNYDRLLYAHGDRVRGLWATLHSMRNVEDTALLKRR